MHRFPRIVALALVAASVGCGGWFNFSYYHQRLASHLPRENGTMLDVECVSYVRHAVSSISPELGTEPRVTVIQDDHTFVVTADRVTLNGEPYGKVPADAKKVRIEYDEEGFTIEADGEPIGPDEIDATE